MSKSPICFQCFDEHGNVRIYDHGILPHWRQSGCTYFVTFRLADSLPQSVRREIESVREAWLRARGINVRADHWTAQFAALPAAERFVLERQLGRLLHQALDQCHGQCVLRDPAGAQIVATALEHFHGSRVWTGDYVVMPNHVHALLTPMNDNELEDVLHSIKSFTANRINERLQRSGVLWQRESYDHIVRDREQLHAYQAYIAANPAKAKLSSGEFLHAAADYYEACSG